MNIYQKEGYANRQAYLDAKVAEHGASLVYALAAVFSGEGEEDVEMLVSVLKSDKPAER